VQSFVFFQGKSGPAYHLLLYDQSNTVSWFLLAKIIVKTRWMLAPRTDCLVPCIMCSCLWVCCALSALYQAISCVRLTVQRKHHSAAAIAYCRCNWILFVWCLYNSLRIWFACSTQHSNVTPVQTPSAGNNGLLLVSNRLTTIFIWAHVFFSQNAYPWWRIAITNVS